jgi:hypothetical protein
MHDPFIKLHHLFSEDSRHQSGPLFILPDKVTEILNGKVYLGSGSFVVSEKAEDIHRLVLEKMAESRQAETLGKT